MPAKTHAAMKADTIKKLLFSARKAFFEQGYGASSMDDLCAQVGLTRGALYHHFGDKKGLLEAVVIQLHEEMGQELLALTLPKDPLKALVQVFEAYLELSLREDIQSIIFQQAPAILGNRLREIDSDMFLKHLSLEIERLRKEKIIKSAHDESLAVMLNGAVMEAALWIALQKDKHYALQVSKKNLRLLLTGLMCT